jgi:hypothetical protein
VKVTGAIRWLAAVVLVIASVVWCVAANYLARVSAGTQLSCRSDTLLFPSDLGLRLWEFGSLLVFLLIGGALSMLPGYGTRRTRLISAAVCALLVVASTWGYVVATHAVMRNADAHGTRQAMVEVAGAWQDPCAG